MRPGNSSSSNIHLSHLLQQWSHEPTIAENIVEWRKEPVHTAQWVEYPDGLHPTLRRYLADQGIRQLYTHQADSWRYLADGKNVVVVTSTASGKTLCYNLPVLDRLLREPQTRALYLFPTKALTQDQFQNLVRLSQWLDQNGGGQTPAAVYDGDTPSGQRAGIRGKARIVLSNPDMLHAGILPHHTRWAEFFRDLRYVIIDEIHTYRGVFGSHVANLLRRLQRVARFYGATPQFILTSATIANPSQLAERLIEQPVVVVDRDGSPRGERNFLLYNPPIINADLGLRASASSESVRLTGDLLAENIQSLLFCRARRSVEILLKRLQQSTGSAADHLRSYRSGYLPRERREIERSLREGEARAVVATNALELGIDIGGMDAVVLVGYPGTIASTRQQAGRAGRQHGASLAVMVASSNPLDQFLMQHPEYIFERSPELALVNPDNLLILFQHIRCATFELPFKTGEGFGRVPAETLESVLKILAQTGELHESGSGYFWMTDRYPSDAVSLRSSSPLPVVLQAYHDGEVRVVGEVDRESAVWMVHPQAIYLHGGLMYEVDELDLENNTARMRAVEVDYYTEPRVETEIEKLSVTAEDAVDGAHKHLGDIMVTSRVTGFRRQRWFTQENLGEGPLDLPPTQLRTTGYWLAIEAQTIEKLRQDGMWQNDANRYGPNWPTMRRLALARDHHTCQSCGVSEQDRPLHVHHKIPFRQFASPVQANQLDNLVSLCPACHQRVELAVKMRSGLAGLGYVLHNLAPLFLMCDIEDLGVHTDPQSVMAELAPVVVLYDMVPAGIGLSDALYEMHADLLAQARDLVSSCPCASGCPSCVGPAGPGGIGGKEETLALLELLSPSGAQ